MKKNPWSIFTLLLIVITGLSCNTSYQTQALQHQSYQVTGWKEKDAGLERLIEPYRENVNKTMDRVIGVAAITLEKTQPESTLGNFMTDAFYIMAEEKYHTKIDAAFVNYGGIRLTQLPAGNITTGKIFELMPFDNLLNLQKVKGTVLQEFLDHIAARGGWPVTGITMQIKNKKAINVMVGGKQIDPNASYTIVNSDYVANGGENVEMLKNIPQISNGYLMRDALLDYIKKLQSMGKDVSAKIEKRVTHAD